jgi:hypothetical protein
MRKISSRLTFWYRRVFPTATVPGAKVYLEELRDPNCEVGVLLTIQGAADIGDEVIS